MPVISHPLHLVYFDIPKVACTSLKVLMWELDNGAPFRTRQEMTQLDRVRRRLGIDTAPRVSGSIHYVPGYQTWSFARAQTLDLPEGYDRITVLRDPIARIFSAWTNKMSQDVFAARDEVEDLHNEGLSDAPGFGAFIDNFERYRDISRPVRVHTQPYAWHLGPSLDAYQHVFRLEALAELESFLSARLGRPVMVGRRNRTETLDRPAQISPAQVDRLLALTAGEYAWLGGLYDPQAGLERLLGKLDN